MASPDLTARLRYLNESAHLLATTAPATSKHLMSQCNSLMFDNGIEQPDSHRRKACGACGTIMIVGWDSELQFKPERCPRGGSPRAVTDRARAMVYTCKSCGRETRFKISISPLSVSKHNSNPLTHTKHTLSKTQASNTTPLGLSTPSESKSKTVSTSLSTSIATPLENSNKKKRAKARKQGGLQAILARQKATDSRGSSGFGLLDFMKKA